MLYQHFYIDYSTMDHKLVPMGSNTEICQVTESMISSSLPSYSYSSSVSSSFSGSFSYLEHSSYLVPEHSNKMETLENATPFLYQDSNQRNIPANVAVVPFQNLQITNSNASFSRVSPIPERPRLNDTFFDSITPFISHENDHINYPISSLQKTAFFDTANIEECSHYDENDFDIGGDLIIDCSPKEDSMFQLAEDENPDFYQQPNNNEENVSLVANQQQHAAVDYRQSSISEESIAFEEKSQKENHDPAAVVTTKNSKKGEKNRNGCFRKFPNKLWDLASDDSFAAINWTEDGKLVCIDTKKLQPQLNRYFRTERFSSFLRQLHLYGFRKIRRSHNIPNINIRKFVYYQLKNFTRSTTDYQPVLG